MFRVCGTIAALMITYTILGLGFLGLGFRVCGAIGALMITYTILGLGF